MIKGLYDFGSVGSWSNVFAEAYWNPGDWQPNKVSFLPAPWGVRIGQPLSNPRNGACFFAATRTERLMNGTGLFRQGNYDRNPIDNSQFGIRFNGVVGPDTPLLPEGLQLQVGYLYQRFTAERRRQHVGRGGPRDPADARRTISRRRTSAIARDAPSRVLHALHPHHRRRRQLFRRVVEDGVALRGGIRLRPPVLLVRPQPARDREAAELRA